MLGERLHEPEVRAGGRGHREGSRGRYVEPGGQRRVRVCDRSLHGPAEALLIHGRVELTGEKTPPPLMMAVWGVGGAGWHAHFHCELRLMGW